MTPDKPIPAQMWNEIADALRSSTEIIRAAQNELRLQVIRVGAKYGFTAAELEARAIIRQEIAARRPGRPKQTDPGERVHVGREHRS